MYNNAPMKNHDPLPTVVYTTESLIRNPKLLLRTMWADLVSSRDLAGRLFLRDLSAQYRQSLLGVIWAFVPPIITGLIFILLQSRNFLNVGETDIPYPVFVFVGTILWQVFTESLNAPLKSLNNATAMLGKINFPREALILASFYTVVFNLLIKLIVLTVILIAFQITFTWGMILALIPIFVLIFLGIGTGLLLSPLGMLYLDISVSIVVATQLFFFVTPVIYPPPESYPDSLIATLNPISPPLIAARDLITQGTIYNLDALIVVTVITFILIFISWLVYRISMPIVIERISA